MPKVDRLRARAKLTRTLRVVGTRDDGYHVLEAEMVTLDLADEIELETGAEGFEVVDEVAWVGDPAGAGPARAARRSHGLRRPHPRSGQPRRSGRSSASAGERGCGSSSASPPVPVLAAVPRTQRPCCAGRACSTPSSRPGLGADVPFCVVGGRALVRGIGESVEPLGFEAVTAVLVTPALVVSTPEVYRAWDALGGPAGDHGNDLEPAALAGRAAARVVARPRFAT